MIGNNLQVDKEQKTVSMERVFDAPRDLVWKVYTSAEFIPQWWGLDDGELVVDKLELREGGEWRFIYKANGREDAFSGEFKEVDPPNKMTWTFNYEPTGPGHELTETIVFEDLGGDKTGGAGRTKISTSSNFLTTEDLDGMLKSGMEKGATQSWNRLEKLLQNMKGGN